MKTPKKKKCPRFHRRIIPFLAEAQNWRCCYCGMVMGFDDVTVEHVMPRAIGGSDEWENMAAACEFCNSAKGAQFGRFLERMWPPPKRQFSTEIERETARMAYEQRQMKRAIKHLRPGA